MLMRDSRGRVQIRVRLLSDCAEGATGEVISVRGTKAHDLVMVGKGEYADSPVWPPEVLSYRTKAEGYPSLRVKMAAAVQATDTKAEAPRRISAIASTESKDRHGDVVEASGWQLDAFRRNPVILVNHDADRIVGKAASVAVQGGKLVMEIEFPPAGAVPLADEIYALVSMGAINALSVGFRILQAAPMPDGSGLRITKAELIECSLVATPANGECLITSRSMTVAERWGLVRQLRADGRRAEIEALRNALPPARAARPTKAVLQAEVDALKRASLRRKTIRITKGEG